MGDDLSPFPSVWLVLYIFLGTLVQARPWFLVPWMVEELIEMVGSLLQVMVNAARHGNW
jgi:hypothetical protein